jgi:glucose/arabinose dehydrogenase
MSYTICKPAAIFFKHFFLLQLLVLLCSLINAQPKLVFTPLIKNISDAVDIKNASDSSNRLFIVRQSGIINIYQYGVLSTRPFLDIHDKITYQGEQGLFSLAFHPGYKNNGLFFIWYSDKKGDVTLTRYKASDPGGDVADPYSGVVLFSLSKPGGYNNHNGGCLQFGKDGYLYLTIGDGGGIGDPYNNAQNMQSLFGKMIRLDINVQNAPYYAIPVDNPFINTPNARPEIFALGLRNPWRWSFDDLTGDIWFGDVGQDTWEEINFTGYAEAAGANYGWHCYEADETYNRQNCVQQSNYRFPRF